jgi:hypothetical protein
MNSAALFLAPMLYVCLILPLATWRMKTRLGAKLVIGLSILAFAAAGLLVFVQMWLFVPLALIASIPPYLYRHTTLPPRWKLFALVSMTAALAVFMLHGNPEPFDRAGGYFHQWPIGTFNLGFLRSISLLGLLGRPSLVAAAISAINQIMADQFVHFLGYVSCMAWLAVLLGHGLLRRLCGQPGGALEVLGDVGPPRFLWLPAIATIAAAQPKGWPWQPALAATAELVYGFYAAVGLILLGGATWRRRHGKLGLGLLALLLLFVSPLAAVPISLGLLDNLTGVRWLLLRPDDRPASERRLPRRRAGAGSAAGVLAAAAALVYLWFGFLRGNPPVYAGPPPPSSLDIRPAYEMVIFQGPRDSFAMDRFAFPNEEGSPPAVGLSYGEAGAACVARGKRLCTAGEWMIAAGGAQQSLFVNPRIDNREHPEFLECYPLKPPSQAPVAGARKGCRNESGVEDLIGGVWQWVATPGWPDNGFHLLKGAAYKYSDDLRAENSYQYWLHDSQFKLIDKSEIGFRCCADAPR